jgi:putative oxidoreductase
MKAKRLFSAGSVQLDMGLLIIRVMVGLLMAFYGYEKLVSFNSLAASAFWQKVSFLGQKGAFPLALTVFAELFCAAFLVLGLFTRFSLGVLMFCMAYIFTVIFPGSIIAKGSNGYEFNNAFVYFVIYLGLFFTGPGKFSLDRAIFGRK